MFHDRPTECFSGNLNLITVDLRSAFLADIFDGRPDAFSLVRSSVLYQILDLAWVLVVKVADLMRTFQIYLYDLTCFSSGK